MSTATNKLLLNTREAAAVLGCSESYVKKHSMGGIAPIIPSVAISKSRRKFSLAGLELFIKRNSSEVESQH
jgi:hypothetical protein